MAKLVAFLRGINLGKRRMKMADLAACFEEAGHADVRTLWTQRNWNTVRRAAG